ncbi:hypothetical protein F2P81_001607 [Scophthalmus maximus]|uniref:Uncharacterized protein n=1 Tax=Scophthalmus maximus TaxID=52904 RepID=A0A6A4TKR1_SCOMX|nr:hypothetical protein F2P81_001607 [Scophthalmus maximus]
MTVLPCVSIKTIKGTEAWSIINNDSKVFESGMKFIFQVTACATWLQGRPSQRPDFSPKTSPLKSLPTGGHAGSEGTEREQDWMGTGKTSKDSTKPGKDVDINPFISRKPFLAELWRSDFWMDVLSSARHLSLIAPRRREEQKMDGQRDSEPDLTLDRIDQPAERERRENPFLSPKDIVLDTKWYGYFYRGFNRPVAVPQGLIDYL